ncbi:hypothetical protein C1H46_037226 [Malus baccata]|uniref:Zinc-finger domain-containing protein n=1 Tax=Malus baccata TaxID=106549 RepID=A0A540KSU7_MALBA|nr:hypothetical protein C1H46_037226 [Malus baccata]
MVVEESNKVEDTLVVGKQRVRAVAGQIYDSKKGVSCHQCRQKMTEKLTALAASCKNVKAKGICPIQFCHKCLWNRYGLKAEQVELEEDWKCPKCQGNCNCSICLKKNGFQPTGLLVYEAKARGFQSVSDMLTMYKPKKQGEEDDKSKDGSPQKRVASDKAIVVSSPRKRGKENTLDRSKDTNLDAALNSGEQETKKARREELMEVCNGSRDGAAAVSNKDAKPKAKEVRRHRKVKECPVNIENQKVDLDLPLPQGNPLTTVAGVELAAEDVGNALQFLKFCETFGEFLKIQKCQAESVLRELSRRGSGRRGRPGQYSSVIRFHNYMLSFIQKGSLEESYSLDQSSYNKSWFQDLGELISASGVSKVDPVLKELSPECFSKGGDGYDMLNITQKLRILIFLCDEALDTDMLSGWIEDQNEKWVQRKRDAKEKVAKAKDKERDLKKKLQEEMTKRIIANNGYPVRISERNSIVSKITSKAAQAHTEVVEAMAMLPKSNEICEAVRIEAYVLDVHGRAFWKLNADFGEDILLQDMGTWDGAPYVETWFVYGAEMKEPIDKYLSFQSLKQERARSQRPFKTRFASNEEDLQVPQTPESNEENPPVSDTFSKQ